MGKITEAKKNYDQFSVDYFNSKGWDSFIIDLQGKRVADVIVLKGNNLGIVEVKSISEQSCDKNYDDTKYLSSRLNQHIGDYLKDARQKVWELLPNRTDKIEKLYAITVACQLFRYFYEFEDLISIYARKIPQNIISELNNPKKSAYLIVPKVLKQKAVTAMNILRSNNYIESYSTDETMKLLVLKVELPNI